MYWDAVLGGLKVFTYWETYVASAIYVVIAIIPVFASGYLMEKAVPAGCLTYMLITPFFQSFAKFVFVFTMAPIILGLGDHAAWTFPWLVLVNMPGWTIMVTGLLLGAEMVVAFVPIFGRSNMLSALIVGGVALAFVVAVFKSVNPNVPVRVSFYPGFWACVSLLVVSAIMSWVVMLVTVLIAGLIETALEGRRETQGLAQWIPLLMAPLGGFLPVFIYGAWLGAQLRGAS